MTEQDVDRRIARAWRMEADMFDKKNFHENAQVRRDVADALDPPEPAFESMERCKKDAEKYCPVQAGGGWIIWGTGLSTNKLPDCERWQAIRVIAEILWAERNRKEAGGPQP
jgi:hypothetical protein